MSTINGQVCVVDGVAVDKVFSNGKQVYGKNLLTGTNNVFTTVTNATGWATGLPTYHLAETLKANQTYTVSCYLEPVEHDVTIYMYADNRNINGTIIAAGSKGISTLTITLTPEDTKAASGFWVSFTKAQTDNSAVSYKGFKLEKGSVATPWTPAPEDVLKGDVTTPNNLVAK